MIMMITIDLTKEQIQILLGAIGNNMYNLEYRRSYNNTNDPEEKYRLQEIEELRSVKNLLKLALKQE